MIVNIKKLSPNAVIPKYAHSTDAGLDLTATSKSFEKFPDGKRMITYGTGLAIEIPEGYVGLLFQRSSVYKTNLSLSNAVGVIDAGYRGEIMFKFNLDYTARPTKESAYKVGDRIGQLLILPYPKIEFNEVKELSETDRGIGGFGSTNK